MSTAKALLVIVLGWTLLQSSQAHSEEAPAKTEEPAHKPAEPAAKTGETAPKADEPAAKPEAPKIDREAIKKEIEGIRAQISGLLPKIDAARRKVAASPELAPAIKAMGEARKAYDDKLNAKVAADAEGGQFVKQVSDLRTKQNELTQKMTEIRKKVSQDPELVEAQKAIADAQKAYNDKLNAKMAADAEGTDIMKQFEESRTHMTEAMAKVAEAKKKLTQDPELAEAQKAMDAASKAYLQEVAAKMASDAEAGGLVKQNEELKTRLDELAKKVTAGK